MTEIFVAILAIILMIGMLWIIWQLFAAVGDMAERRGQDRRLWQIAALFINPVGAMLLLWLFCDLKDSYS